MSRARIERCVCGGSIIANVDAPGPAVLAHNRSPQHVAWSTGVPEEELEPGQPMPIRLREMTGFSPAELRGRR